MHSWVHMHHEHMCTTLINLFGVQGCPPHANTTPAPLICQQARGLLCNTLGQCSREGSHEATRQRSAWSAGEMLTRSLPKATQWPKTQQVSRLLLRRLPSSR